MLAAGRRFLIDALAPQRCAGCDAVSATVLCRRCEAAITAGEPVCRRAAGGTACGAFAFDGAVREAVHRGKYRGGQDALRALARVAAPRWTAALCPPDALVAVPLGVRRRRSRGYNQAEVIAAEAAAAMGAGCLEGLVRRRETPPQSARDEAARRANVAEAFAWRGIGLEGRRIWLVDDVLTTGATAAAASAPLIAAGARRVDVAVLAAVP